MDADGLPIVGRGIDFTKVGAIHQKRTLAFLNHFIIHTGQFLNRFSRVCEEKLEALTIKIQRLETTMNILEAKLSSIPGLENVTVAAPSTDTPSTATTSEISTYSTSQPQPQQEPQPQQTNTVDPTVKEEAAEEKPPVMTVSQDPRYAKYFKMIQVGVPAGALKQKMILDGLDPNLLENPSAPVPDGGASAATKQDSDSDFSDEEQEQEESSDSSGFGD